jgi:hypothetical protein
VVSDPLRSQQGQEKLLFDLFAQVSIGKNADAVMGAAINMIMNAIRQNYPTRDAAEQKIDELFGRGKSLLLANHYDSTTGRRRSVIPHTQIVRMAYHMEDDFDVRKNGPRS